MEKRTSYDSSRCDLLQKGTQTGIEWTIRRRQTSKETGKNDFKNISIYNTLPSLSFLQAIYLQHTNM